MHGILGTTQVHLKQVRQKTKLRGGREMQALTESEAAALSKHALVSAAALQSALSLDRTPEQVLTHVTAWWHAEGAKLICGAENPSTKRPDEMQDVIDAMDAFVADNWDVEAEAWVEEGLAEALQADDEPDTTPNTMPVGGEAHVMEALQHRLDQRRELLAMQSEAEAEAADADAGPLSSASVLASVEEEAEEAEEAVTAASGVGQDICQDDIRNLPDILGYIRKGQSAATAEVSLCKRLEDLRAPLTCFVRKVQLAEKTLSPSTIMGNAGGVPLNSRNLLRHNLRKAADFTTSGSRQSRFAYWAATVKSARPAGSIKDASTFRPWSVDSPQVVAYVLTEGGGNRLRLGEVPGPPQQL